METGSVIRMIAAAGVAAVLALLLAGCHASPAASAANGWEQGVWIVGVDGQARSESRESSLSRRAADGLHDAFGEAGFRTKDAAAGIAVEGRMNQGQLLAVLRQAPGADSDLMLGFRVFPSLLEANGGTRARLRVEARMVAVDSGRLVVHGERSSARPLAYGPDCNRSCVEAELGAEARLLARELGTALAAELAGSAETQPATASRVTSPAPQAVNLIIDGFRTAERAGLEQGLEDLAGYRNHRLVRSQETHVEWWYESSLELATLRREVERLVAAEGLPALVRTAGRTIRVDATRQRPAPEAAGYQW